MDADRSTSAGATPDRLTSVEDHLTDLTLRAAHHLGPDVDCSVILRHAGGDRRVASSSRRAAQCDDAENAAGEGPCLTAMTELHSVVVPDVLAEFAWPTWRRAVLVAGYRSAAAFPAHVPPDADVAFNLYCEAFDPWTRDLVVHADLYAQEIARVAALALDLARLERAHAELSTASDDRRTVDRAVGVTIAQRGCSAAEAAERLRATAQARGVALADVAREVVDDATGRTAQRG